MCPVCWFSSEQCALTACRTQLTYVFALPCCVYRLSCVGSAIGRRPLHAEVWPAVVAWLLLLLPLPLLLYPTHTPDSPQHTHTDNSDSFLRSSCSSVVCCIVTCILLAVCVGQWLPVWLGRNGRSVVRWVTHKSTRQYHTALRATPGSHASLSRLANGVTVHVHPSTNAARMAEVHAVLRYCADPPRSFLNYKVSSWLWHVVRSCFERTSDVLAGQHSQCIVHSRCSSPQRILVFFALTLLLHILLRCFVPQLCIHTYVERLQRMRRVLVPR